MSRPAPSVAFEPIEPGERTRRQVAVRLLPFLFVLYVANYIDRTSVAFAALGMSGDLGLSDRTLGLAAGIFFVSYIALRLVLGSAEAGFFPGVIVYLSRWFSRTERARAVAYFMAAIPFSQAIASPLAGWIVGHAFAGMQGWRWLFILEGLPAALLGAVACFYLTDRPSDAHWLPPRQREWMIAKLRAEEAPPVAEASSPGPSPRSRIIAILALGAFLNYFVSYGFYFWFPTMLKRQSGLSDVLVGLIGTVPYAVLFVSMLVNGWHSDRRMERRWHAAVPCLLAAIGAVGLMGHPQSPSIAVVLYTLLAITPAALPPFWGICTALLRSSAAPAVIRRSPQTLAPAHHPPGRVPGPARGPMS